MVADYVLFTLHFEIALGPRHCPNFGKKRNFIIECKQKIVRDHTQHPYRSERTFVIFGKKTKYPSTSGSLRLASLYV